MYARKVSEKITFALYLYAGSRLGMQKYCLFYCIFFLYLLQIWINQHIIMTIWYNCVGCGLYSLKSRNQHSQIGDWSSLLGEINENGNWKLVTRSWLYISVMSWMSFIEWMTKPSSCWENWNCWKRIKRLVELNMNHHSVNCKTQQLTLK